MRNQRVGRAGRIALLLLAAAAGAAAEGPLCGSGGEDEPLVVLALDGVPYGVVEQARREGAFQGWPATRRLVSTFPSMTNVSFAAIFAPLGVAPIAGYEIPHFDREEMRMVGKSPFGAKKRSYGWREVVDKELLGGWDHTVAYAAPRHRARVELAEVESKVLAGGGGVHVVYVAATDALTHFRGHDGLLRYLLELERRLGALQADYQRRWGRCLRLALLSDHGNTERKVRRVRGVRRRLRAAGFRVGSRLRGPKDAVAPTFGLCNYGAIYVQEGRAGDAARAIVAHPRVELAAFLAAAGQIAVLSKEGSAEIAWRPGDGGTRYRYRPGEADPLDLAAAASRLLSRGAVDGDGFASARDWLVESAEETYPNAPERIVDSLTGAQVEHSASVLFSIEPGWAWGRRAGYLGASLKGGRLEGTHGGLDAVSSLGFFLVNDPAIDPGHAVSAEGALSFLAGRQPVLTTGQ